MKKNAVTLLNESYDIAFAVKHHFITSGTRVTLNLSRPEITVSAPSSGFKVSDKHTPRKPTPRRAQLFCKQLSKEFQCRDVGVFKKIRQPLDATNSLWPVLQLVTQITEILGVTPEAYTSDGKQLDIGFTWLKK